MNTIDLLRIGPVCSKNERNFIMHVISVINYKGGVGKTTITANLGAELARRGRQVLLIDIDPQASLTFSFIPPEEWARTYADSKTLKHWFQSYEEDQPITLKDVIFTPAKIQKKLDALGAQGRLDLVSSHMELINIDLDLAVKLGGASLKDAIKNFLRIHSLLAKGIKQIEKEGYDFVLIDCPPNFNIVTKTAIIASHYLLIPVKPDYLSAVGIDSLIASYKNLLTDYNEYVNFSENKYYSHISSSVLGIIFNKVKTHNEKPVAVLSYYMKKIERFELPVFQAYLREHRSLFSNEPSDGVPFILGNYGSKARGEVVREIEAFVNEFEYKLEG